MQADMEKKCENIWSKYISLLRNQVIPEHFETIFAPIKALDCKGNVLSKVISAVSTEMSSLDLIKGTDPTMNVSNKLFSKELDRQEAQMQK